MQRTPSTPPTMTREPSTLMMQQRKAAASFETWATAAVGQCGRAAQGLRRMGRCRAVGAHQQREFKARPAVMKTRKGEVRD